MKLKLPSKKKKIMKLKLGGLRKKKAAPAEERIDPVTYYKEKHQTAPIEKWGSDLLPLESIVAAYKSFKKLQNVGVSGKKPSDRSYSKWLNLEVVAHAQVLKQRGVDVTVKGFMKTKFIAGVV